MKDRNVRLVSEGPDTTLFLGLSLPRIRNWRSSSPGTKVQLDGVTRHVLLRPIKLFRTERSTDRSGSERGKRGVREGAVRFVLER